MSFTVLCELLHQCQNITIYIFIHISATISGDVTAGAPLEFGTFFWDTVLNLNLNSLLVTRQMTLFHQGVRMGEKLEANLDTRSSDISAEETSESGRSFQSLIVCGKKLLLYASFRCLAMLFWTMDCM